MANNKEFQEVNLKKLFASIVAMWWLIALFVVVAIVSSFVITTGYMTPVYEASTTLFIGKDTDVLSSISMSDLQIDSKLVLDYRELLRTKLVTREVIDELGLRTTHETMIRKLDVSTLSDSRFVSVIYLDSKPERAALVANKLSETLVIKAQDIVGVDNIQIVDYADIPEYPEGPNLIVNMIIATFIALVISILIIFILNKLDNRLKTKQDIEDFIGLSVLSEIPKIKGGK